ncbi:TipAS antibiotic-recognition domain-containing protein [Paenibacillus solisilvae]|uniref:TipAS antibiotic-recognition domain-containing protein n=1 Tax=Paenibacillus solisilvae TaxID=2486751 RepID=A0ABW0W599_9BACL
MGTLNESIISTARGETMDTTKMFRGFEDEEEWQTALAEQKQYLKEAYEYDLLKDNTIDVEVMNEQAAEAVQFMNGMAKSLQEGLRYDDAKVRIMIREHLDFLNNIGHEISDSGFAAQARFFLNDDFHRNMLESVQIGLAYYLCAAAEALATE